MNWLNKAKTKMAVTAFLSNTTACRNFKKWHKETLSFSIMLLEKDTYWLLLSLEVDDSSVKNVYKVKRLLDPVNKIAVWKFYMDSLTDFCQQYLHININFSCESFSCSMTRHSWVSPKFKIFVLEIFGCNEC